LADAGWGRDADGETQHRERHHANASCSVAGHDQWPPISRDGVSLYPIWVETGIEFFRARLYSRQTFSLQIEAKGYLLH
jgi:hypothetical protein